MTGSQKVALWSFILSVLPTWGIVHFLPDIKWYAVVIIWFVLAGLIYAQMLKITADEAMTDLKGNLLEIEKMKKNKIDS